MRSHCAVYVDAGYLLAAAATRVSGASLRSSVDVDYELLITKLAAYAEAQSGLPMLRVHWYDGARDGVVEPTHERIGLLPRVKVRLGRIGYEGEQKGVDLRIGLDMVAHARNGAVEVMYLVSGDDDLSEAVEEAQAQGVQVVILGVPTKAGAPHGVNRHLQRASDGLELIKASVIDEAVKPTTAAIVAAVAAAPMAAPAAPVPSPATTLPKPGSHLPPKAPAIAPTSNSVGSIVYSSVTGSGSVVAGEYGKTDDELNQIIDSVAEKVARAWIPTVAAAERDDLLAERRYVPGDVDRTLLVDASDAIGVYDLSTSTRFRLRERFWDAVDRAVSP